MNCGNDCERKKELKNCLIQLNLLFQWLAAVENKPIEQDGTEMGSNFAKYKIIPEYKEFIQPACKAEEHFERKEYPECAERCRNSTQQFIEYLFSQFGWQKPIGNIEPNEPSLDQLIKDSNVQDFLKKKGSRSHTYSKKFGNDATHQPFYETDESDAFKCLYDLFYLITKSISRREQTDKKQLPNPVGGAQRFDPSLLANHSEELIKPQLGIEFVKIETRKDGKEKEEIVFRNILQNVLLEAVLSKKVSESLVKENLSLIDKTDALGNTPLSLAVYNDDYNTVKMLLENGADPNFYYKNERADFRKSVNDEVAKEITKNVPLNDALKEEYKSILSETKDGKVLETLERLLKERVWFENIEAHNCIPLIVAIKKDNVDIVALLLQYGAKTWDSCIDDWYGVAKIPTECSTVLACAFFYNAKKCIRYLLKNDIGNVNEKTVGAGVTPLLLAVENNIYVDKLLEKGARIDLRDDYGNSVFLHAVQNMRHDYELLEKLLEKAKSELSEMKLKNLLNDPGLAGCPISYMDKNEAELFLEYGADVNAKDYWEVPCIVDVAHLNPKDMLPWFKEHGAKLDFKTFFYANSYLEPKYVVRASRQYDKKIFTEVLRTAAEYDLITSKDLDFTVPIDNIPRISPLVDAILFSKAYEILNSTKDGKKSEKEFLSDAQLNELHDKYPVIKELSKLGRKISSYSQVNEQYSDLEKWVNEGQPVMGSQKDLTAEEILKLPKHKLDFNIDMTLEDVHKAIASVKELSRDQRIALFERYPFVKQLEMRGIDLNVPEEIESNYNTDWAMSSAEIVAAIKDVKSEIPYEDIEISPLDDALIAKNYDAAAIYLTKGINVSELTKILLLSVHDVPKKDTSAWNKVQVALKLRKDIDFSDVLIHLCKNHPKDGFDIAEEFVNNGYNFYRFANYTLPDFWVETFASGISNCDYAPRMHRVKNEDGTYNESPSIEDIRKRNNSSFLKTFGFGETSFKDVNLRLIRKAISFGVNPHEPDEIHKTALDYAKENGIDERVLKVRPSVQKGVICKIQSDKTDKTKIFNGQVRGTTDGRLYNFKKRIHDKNFKEVVYDDSYKEKNVFFVIQKDSKDPVHPGLADLVTLVDI